MDWFWPFKRRRSLQSPSQRPAIGGGGGNGGSVGGAPPNPQGPGPFFPARYIDTLGAVTTDSGDDGSVSVSVGTGTEVWTYACNEKVRWCNNMRAIARYVDRVSTDSGIRDVWAFASQCCEYPPGLDMGFVGLVHDSLGNSGPVSKHLYVTFHPFQSGASCADLCGFRILCTYGADGHWRGQNGHFSADLYLTDPSLPNNIQLKLTSDCGPTPPEIVYNGNLLINCAFPLEAVVTGLSSACCVCGGFFAATVTGFCRRRHIARLVDFIKARFHHKTTGTGTGTFPIDTLETGTGTLTEVWAYGECCHSPCSGVTCCSLYTACTLHLSVSSSCACLNETVALTYHSSGCRGSSPCWQGSGGSHCTGDFGYLATLTCQTDPSDPEATLWTLDVGFIANGETPKRCVITNFIFQYRTRLDVGNALENRLPDCFPLDLTFASQNGTCVQNPGHPPCNCTCSSFTFKPTVTL